MSTARFTGARALEPPTTRQGSAAAFRPSGAVYVISHELLRPEWRFIVPGLTRGVILPRARAVDVDTVDDLAEAETRLAWRPARSFASAGGRSAKGSPAS